jgi:hypothetical protein
MGCGGILILLVIYSIKNTIYILFIFFFNSVMGVNIKETRISQPASLQSRARDEDWRTCVAFVTEKLYGTEIITKTCLLRCKITHIQITVIIYTSEQGYNAAISSWRDMQITHTQITIIIDTSEQGYNAAISSWWDMQNYTPTSILLAGRSCSQVVNLSAHGHRTSSIYVDGLEITKLAMRPQIF